TQFRRVTVLIFHIRNTSASAHTNYLVNFLKSVERLLNQGGVFYIVTPPCQPFVFRRFPASGNRRKTCRLTTKSWCAFYAEPLACQPVSEEF
ncbi:MAG TPA: hypothetical protein VFN01_17130, partial [Marinobacter sp.]|uniref:hypothetical protein n=1 Tax=Marinobacter sp. TaxID=50741 RepID=UPI002D7EBFD6